MNIHMLLVCFFSFIFIFIFPLAKSDVSGHDFHYTNCSRPFVCTLPSTRSINISYPFWGSGRPSYCGLQEFELQCGEYASLKHKGQVYRVLDIDQPNQVITMARNDLWDTPCLGNWFPSTTMDDSAIFRYTTAVNNLTILYCINHTKLDLSASFRAFPCPVEIHQRNKTALFNKGEALGTELQENPELGSCSTRIKIPVRGSKIDEFLQGQGDWRRVMTSGFDLTYKAEAACSACVDSGGTCGTNSSYIYDFVCYCPDKAYQYTCSDHEPRNKTKDSTTGGSNISLKIGIGVLAGGILVSASVILYLCKARRRMPFKGQRSDRDIKNFIKQHGSIGPRRFSYSQVKRMTDSFRSKLGQGGFGTVYKGKLPDGTLVAVKLLNESKGNGEEFINEVASISRTSHVNIVALLGFCYEGRNRALIYEFMSNGSLDKFISDEDALGSSSGLGWEKLSKIAEGIARGLEYLHRGCSTRIVHFDIKPQNILLDDDFCPKISDFGLSKICVKRESVVSMLVARGTIGYIAPEVFSRNFGEVSHKSDVYSYRMMLLEIVGGRQKDSNLELGQSSEVYFHDRVYRLVDKGCERGIYGHLTEDDKETARKMALVGMWCIQADPKQRPSMRRVIEMLEGSLESLQIPPKPFLFYAPIEPIGSISISTSP